MVNREFLYATGACGLAAPFTFFAAVIIAGLLRPGYDHVTQPVTVLGTMNDPASVIMLLVGFAATGGLIALLSIGVYLDLKTSPVAKGALTVVLFIAGVALFLTGVFLWSPTDDLSSTMMSVTGAALGLAPLIAALVFRQDVHWKPFWAFSLLIALIVLAFFALFTAGTAPNYNGLIQRVYLGAALVWAGTVGYWILRWV